MDAFWAQNKDLIIVFLVLVVLAIPIALIYTKMNNRPDAVKKAARERRRELLYKIYTTTPFLKTYTKKVYHSIRKIAASGEHETRVYTVNCVNKALIFAFVTIMLGTLVLENPISIGIVWLAAYIMLTHVLRMETNRLNKKLLYNFAPWVGLLREEYLRTDNITESFASAETPDCLQTSSARIQAILESSNSDYELNRFIQETQCSYIRTLAMAAVKVNDNGDDTDIDKKQESVFVKALKYIEEDAYNELERIQNLDAKFSNDGLLGLIGGLPTLCLAPMLCCTLVPVVMLSIMSMLQAWYGGLIAQIANVAICAVCVVAFASASKLMSHEGVILDDRKLWVTRLLKNKTFAKLCHWAAPKRDKKHKLEKILNDASSTRTPLDISCERLVMAVAAFVLCMIACFSATAYQADYFSKTTKSFSLMANDDTSMYTTEEILAVDNEYIVMLQGLSGGAREKKAFDLLNDDETAAFVKGRFTELGDVQVSDQVARLRKKYDNINGAYFKWWMTLICIGAGCIGFFYPEYDLKKNRLAQVRIEERDDFMQLQTLCTILASANCDVMDTLDEMSKLSRLYKRRILTCYLNYATNPEKEIARLASKVKIGNFKHLCKKISLAVDQLSLKEAFEGMDIERKHILEERKIENMQNTNNKREKANVLLKASMFMMLINTLLAPILVVGVTSLVEMLGQMQAVM